MTYSKNKNKQLEGPAILIKKKNSKNKNISKSQKKTHSQSLPFSFFFWGGEGKIELELSTMFCKGFYSLTRVLDRSKPLTMKHLGTLQLGFLFLGLRSWWVELGTLCAVGHPLGLQGFVLLRSWAPSWWVELGTLCAVGHPLGLQGFILLRSWAPFSLEETIAGNWRFLTEASH